MFVLPFSACPASAQGVSKLGERNAAHVSRELQGEQPYGVRRMCKFFAAASSSILEAPKATKNCSFLCLRGQNLPVLFFLFSQQLRCPIIAIIGHKLPKHRAQYQDICKQGDKNWDGSSNPESTPQPLSVYSQHRGL